MIVTLIVNKFKSLLLLMVTLIRRALCCFRRRRRVSCDGEPLTDIGIVTNEICDGETWNDWEANNFTNNRKPVTVQDHIEFYRQQKAVKQCSEEGNEQVDFFEDMAPKITRQKRVFINTGGTSTQHTNSLLLAPDPNLMASHLGEWEENPGWEGETLDWDAQEALREKKRQERERKALEQQQRRLERSSKTNFGNNIST